MERCPSCSARLKGAVVCPRCSANLGLAIGCATQSNLLIQQAFTALERGDSKLALSYVKRSLFVRNSPLGVVLRDFIEQRLQQEAKQRQASMIRKLKVANNSLVELIEELSET